MGMIINKKNMKNLFEFKNLNYLQTYNNTIRPINYFCLFLTKSNAFSSNRIKFTPSIFIIVSS